METAPDDFERARAAVAISCLEWLRSIGPGPVPIEPFRHDPRAVRRMLSAEMPPRPTAGPRPIIPSGTPGSTAESPPTTPIEARMLLRRQVSQERDEHIDMTPMVDVVFQLMTFMLFSVQLAGDAKVDVPRARRGVGVEETAATFLTLLKPDAPGAKPRLLVGNGDDGRAVDLDQAGAVVSEGVAKGLRKVVIQADGDVPEGEVLRLIGELGKREAGITIHIGVQEPE